MRFYQLKVVVLPRLFLLVVLTCLPKQAYGIGDIVDWNTSDDADADKNHNAVSNHELSLLDFDGDKIRVASRLLQDDERCSDKCDSTEISNLRESMTKDDVEMSKEKDEDEDDNGILGRITGFFNDHKSFFGRLISGLFRLFNRRQDDDPHYPVPTATIVPLLSTHSEKIKSLAQLLRQESANNSALSTTPDAIRMMFNISASNMESVAAVLDPILENMQQYETMDIRTIACRVTDLLILLRDDTVPNIISMTQLIYTKSNIAEMKEKFPQEYTPVSSSESSTTSSIIIAGRDKNCVSESASTRTTSTSRVTPGSLFNFLFNNIVDVGPIGRVLAIVLLLILLPIAIVASLIGLIVLWFYLILSPPSMGDEDNTFLAILSAIGSPIVIIVIILEAINGFDADILNPFIPGRPTPAPIIYTPYPTPLPVPNPLNVMIPAPDKRVLYPTDDPPPIPATAPVNAPFNPVGSGQGRNLQQINDVEYCLKELLKSPILVILQELQNGNRIADSKMGEGEESLDCDMAAVKCNNDALMDVLPF